KRTILCSLLVGLIISARADTQTVNVNVLLDTEPTEAVVASLAVHGAVLDVITELAAVVLQTQQGELGNISSLPHVVSVTSDASAAVGPRSAARNVQSTAGGRSTFNQDAINISDLGVGRTVSEDGDGVYVALIDTGLVPDWRAHLPKQRVNI